jgi:hypothetical protein
MIKKNLIEKYPYLGYSPNIIEYFGIVGYQEEFISTIIKEMSKTSFSIPNNPFSPTILNSVISSIDYGITDNDLMLKQIYPDNPNLIKANPYEYNEQLPPPSSIIYSFCFDSTDGKKKLFYTCYGYKFYEKYKIPNKMNEIYYVPKAFTIISQYAFYNTFHYICENLWEYIYSDIKKKLPLEIVIYSLLNYLPAPMNYNINLSIFDSLLNAKPIKLEQLTGYPYIDFDLSEIFNLLPINFMLQIYILTFLEQKMLFFSQNLEILNMVMYIMFLLNYPINDSVYFWHIVSVSINDFHEENRFVSQVMDSLLGVNALYDDRIDTSAFGSYHFIVDLDNKKMILKTFELESIDEEDVNDLIKIQDFIDNSLRDRNIESTFLKNTIKELKTGVEAVLMKDVNYTPNPRNKYVNFFKILPKTLEKNKKIQENFYNFCLNILMVFYRDNELNTSFDKITNEENKLKSDLIIKDNNVTLTEAEKLFCEFFRDSVKYKIYYENFIQNFETMKIFKIPFLFSEEFINLKLNDIDNKALSDISFFAIIDTLYMQAMPQTINVTINNLISEYNENMKKEFAHFDYNKKKNERDKQLFCLDRKILNRFIYLMNNKFDNEEKKDLFPSSRLQTGDFISFFDKRCIKDIIQNYLITTNIIKTQHCLIYSVVYVFAMTMSLLDDSSLLTFLCEVLKSLDDVPFFKRYCINIIIQTFHNYFLINSKTNSYPQMSLNKMKIYYYMTVNYFKQNGMIPDEDIMAVLSYFFGGTILQDRESSGDSSSISSKDKELELISQTPFDIKFNHNFLCYVKYSFTGEGTFKQKNLVKAALKENRNSNIVINASPKKKLFPIIVVKIKDYVYTARFFSPIKILKSINLIFSDFFENYNFDLRKCDIRSLREIITNLIQYGLELSTVHIPFDFLIHSLYLLKDIEKCEKKEINIIKEEKKEMK